MLIFLFARILAEGAIARSVTLSGGALFATSKLFKFTSNLTVKVILAILMGFRPTCCLLSESYLVTVLIASPALCQPELCFRSQLFAASKRGNDMLEYFKLFMNTDPERIPSRPLGYDQV